MKKFLAVLLCMIMLVSASGFSALAGNYTFVTVDKDFGEVSFDADFAEIGVPIKVNVPGSEGRKLIYRWYIDGIRIENDGDTYTPLECDMQSMISVEVFDVKGNLVGSTSMFVSNLPVIYIETENRQPVTSKKEYINADIKIQGNSEYNSDKVLYEGKTEIRGRGNSTWNTDKKPYRLKLDSKADLFGMGKNKHWVLLSNPFDTSLLRNHLSYNLAADMGLGYQKNVWVDLVFNGKVVGNYQLCEHIRVDDNRVDITNWEDLAEDAAKAIYDANKATMTKDQRDELIEIMSENMSWTTSDTVEYNGVTYTVSDYIEIPDINGGYLLEVVKKSEEYTFATENGSYVCVDTPEVLSKDMLKSIQGYYQAFENALFSEDFCTTYNGETKRYTDFIDLESFAKGFLLNELFENYDFGRTSTWMSKDVDGKLVYGPVWDMDYTTSSITHRWTALNISWLKRLLSDPVFLQELRKTYFEYRYTAIQDLISDGGDIDSAMEKISASAKNNDYIWQNDISAEENAVDLKLRLQSKINWLDSVLTNMPSAYASMASNIANMECVNSDALSLSFDQEKNSLNVEFDIAVPSFVKVFADGKYCGEFIPLGSVTEFTLPKIKEGAVITAVCYDENSNVIFGSYCITEKEIIKLFVSSHITKFNYDAGEMLDLSDIELTARYSDGTEEKVNYQLAYTYVKDSLGEQFFSYDKVTEEIGKTFIVLRYGNVSKEYEIQVNPKENYSDVVDMIKKLPKEIIDNRFVRNLFEAQIAYDALSESAKSKVTNISKLNSLMTDLAENESETTGVIACTADGVFRINARSSLIVVSKGNPNKIMFVNPSEGTTSTYTTASSAYLYKKTVGDYTVSTIKHLIPNDINHEFLIRSVYSDSHKTEEFKILSSEISNETKALNSVRYAKWFNEGDTFKITVDRDPGVHFFSIYENGQTVSFSAKDTANITTIIPNIKTPGKHTVLFRYSYGNSTLDYGYLDIFVREYKEETNRIISIDYPAESYKEAVEVNITTSADVEKLELVCGEAKIPMTAKTVDDLNFWTAEIDITDNKEYTLYLNSQETMTVIAPKFLDSFEIEGTKIVKFLADTETAEIPENITEIADDAFDGFEGKIICHPGSVAEEFAKEKGIDFETFEIKANVSEIRIDSGESFEVEITATPYLPKDFNLNYDFDESVISFDGKTVTALKPGYAKLNLYSDNKLYSETIYVYVGGGPRLADINADGKINSLDALSVLQHSVEKITLTGDTFDAADVNGDGKVNSVDALTILQISTEKKSIWDLI